MTRPAGGLEGKAFLVTGGGTGIGAACARRFAEQGSTVVLADRNDNDDLAQNLDPMAVKVDVRDEVSVARLYSIVNQSHGRLDVLAHLAGVAGLPALVVGLPQRERR